MTAPCVRRSATSTTSSTPSRLRRARSGMCSATVLADTMSRPPGQPVFLRYELRSGDQWQALAAASLPPGFSASPPRRSLHRDLYLDTADDALHRRGVL